MCIEALLVFHLLPGELNFGGYF